MISDLGGGDNKNRMYRTSLALIHQKHALEGEGGLLERCLLLEFREDFRGDCRGGILFSKCVHGRENLVVHGETC